ncbi:DUF5985 family protein [Sphingomonas oligophenolica]|uniref:Uncharacterized protein n=1 Tax=Sphingomonas oligophenolica TaxID=301154 RepID=A0A502BYC5_9SPHN|nr:DUF5985 family protein [Sphingomonas oligophenolica]TPG05513.1 hypothetical protein EAH84_15105 [Sphingomonas oligophenolica]
MTSYFAPAVYLLCFMASTACMVLLGRTYAKGRAPLLLWSAICFGLLAANNLMLVLDLLAFPDDDLRIFRAFLSLAGVSTLIFGFIWSAQDE